MYGRNGTNNKAVQLQTLLFRRTFRRITLIINQQMHLHMFQLKILKRLKLLRHVSIL